MEKTCESDGFDEVNRDLKQADMSCSANAYARETGRSVMELDSGYLILSIIFSGFGMFLFMFGKRAGKMPHLIAGLALMTCPYFITNLIAMTLVCLVLAVAPFFVKE